MPANKKFEIITPSILSLITMGRKVKTTPAQEQMIFNKIACITLKRTNFVNGDDRREHKRNTQTIKMNMSKLLSA